MSHLNLWQTTLLVVAIGWIHNGGQMPAVAAAPKAPAATTAPTAGSEAADAQPTTRSATTRPTTGMVIRPLRRPNPSEAGTSTRPEARPTTRAIHVDPEPSRITVHGVDLTADQILESFSRQSGIRFEFFPDDPTRHSLVQRIYTIDINNQPFWMALRSLTNQTDIATTPDRHPVFREADPGVYYVGRTPSRLRTGGPNVGMYDGPVLFTPGGYPTVNVERVSIAHQVEPDAPRHAVFLTVSTLIEPKYRGNYISGSMLVTEAIDSNGNSLIATAKAGISPIPSGMNRDTDPPMMDGEYIYLPRPQQPTERIVRLVGTAKFNIVQDLMEVEIDKPLEVGGVEIERAELGAFRISIGETRMDGEQSVVEVLLERGKADDELWRGMVASFATWTRRIQMFDAQDNPIPHAPGLKSERTDDRFIHTIRFAPQQRPGNKGAASGPPARLKWDVPVKTSILTATFRFEDIPLP